MKGGIHWSAGTVGGYPGISVRMTMMLSVDGAVGRAWTLCCSGLRKCGCVVFAEERLVDGVDWRPRCLSARLQMIQTRGCTHRRFNNDIRNHMGWYHWRRGPIALPIPARLTAVPPLEQLLDWTHRRRRRFLPYRQPTSTVLTFRWRWTYRCRQVLSRTWSARRSDLPLETPNVQESPHHPNPRAMNNHRSMSSQLRRVAEYAGCDVRHRLSLSPTSTRAGCPLGRLQGRIGRSSSTPSIGAT